MIRNPAELPLDYRHLFHRAPINILVLRPDDRYTILEATDLRLESTLTRREAIIGRPLFEVFPDNPADPEASGVRHLRDSLEQVRATGETHRMAVQRYDIRNPHAPDGFECRYWEPRNIPVFSPRGHMQYIFHVAEDVTRHTLASRKLRGQVARRTAELAEELKERELMAANLAHYTRHDPVTGLPNRLTFNEALSEAAVGARTKGERFALIHLGLDGFAEIYHAFGHLKADALLGRVALRLRRSLPGRSRIGRQAGDEFLILLPRMAHPEQARELAARLLVELAKPFSVEEREVSLSACAGVALFPEDGTDLARLHRKAHEAMRRAKRVGRGRFEFASEDVRDAVIQRMDLKRDLVRALREQAIVVHYQPKVDLRTRRVVGAEALVRWQQADGTFRMPDTFIPLAEEYGLINALGKRVIDRVCADLAKWREAGFDKLRISLNASPHQLRDRQLLKDMRAALDRRPELSRNLELELTEGVLIEHSRENRAVLAALTDWGVRIAIDDFGTGCSGLNYFKQFHIDTLKIDKSFVQGADEHRADDMIVKAIIDMARNFELAVVAEGIETQAQADRLETQHCLEGQGYLFGKAMPPEAFVAQLGR